MLFNGNEEHETRPYFAGKGAKPGTKGGTRISFIAFSHQAYNKLSTSVATRLKALGFTACSDDGVDLPYFTKYRIDKKEFDADENVKYFRYQRKRAIELPPLEWSVGQRAAGLRVASCSGAACVAACARAACNSMPQHARAPQHGIACPTRRLRSRCRASAAWQPPFTKGGAPIPRLHHVWDVWLYGAPAHCGETCRQYAYCFEGGGTFDSEFDRGAIRVGSHSREISKDRSI